MEAMERLVAKFKSVSLVPNGECLDWPGETDKNGYGVVRAGHRRTGGVRGRAPRVAWAAAHPDEPLPLVVRHTCDRPRCVRSDHLLGGTAKQNMQDAVDRGRHRPGVYEPLDEVPCPVCSKPFKSKVILSAGRRQETCSKSCAGKLRALRGEKPPRKRT